MTIFRNKGITNLIIFFVLLIGIFLAGFTVPSNLAYVIGLPLYAFSAFWYFSVAKELNDIDNEKLPMTVILIQCFLFVLIPVIDGLFFKSFDFIEGDKIIFPFASLLFPINGFILFGILIFHLQSKEKKYFKKKQSDLISDIIEIGILPVGFFRTPKRIDVIKKQIAN